MDLLAAGQEWPAADAAAAYAAAYARDAAYAAAYARDAAYAAADAANAARAAYAAAYAAANAAGVGLRQRDLLLRLITEAPIVPSPIAA
jgi:phosphoribosylformylglycinamidine (FGAM) synthase-like enzyme